jgi:hypothetical protein
MNNLLKYPRNVQLLLSLKNGLKLDYTEHRLGTHHNLFNLLGSFKHDV